MAITFPHNYRVADLSAIIPSAKFDVLCHGDGVFKAAVNLNFDFFINLFPASATGICHAQRKRARTCHYANDYLGRG
jgi:hypothetical protein